MNPILKLYFWLGKKNSMYACIYSVSHKKTESTFFDISLNNKSYFFKNLQIIGKFNFSSFMWYRTHYEREMEMDNWVGV